MDKIVITKDVLLAARDYMPLAEKEAWTAENAPKCFDRLSITSDGDPMPPMYMVNVSLKARYLMAVLTSYLHMEYEADEKDPALMSEACYDAWAGSHMLNQLERWKSDKDVRDKCFDLLSDYNDLSKRFGAQINGLLGVQNDFVLRQSQYTAAQMKELPGVIEQLKKLQEERENGKQG